MKDERVTVKVSPALGLALETRKLELKKKGIPVKSMEDLISRLLAESSGEVASAAQTPNVAELGGHYTCGKDEAVDVAKLLNILRNGGKYRRMGIRSNLDAFVGDMKRSDLEDQLSGDKSSAGQQRAVGE